MLPCCRRVRAFRTSIAVATLFGCLSASDAVAQDSFRSSLEAIERAVAQDEYGTALELLAKLQVAANRSADRSVKQELQQQRTRLGLLQREFHKLQPAWKRLKESSGDSDASAAVGRFYCLLKGDWKRGLPILARGSASHLRSAALLDLQNPQTPEHRFLVGNAWMEAVADCNGGEQIQQAQLRARHWYLAALQGAADALKGKIEERLDEIGIVPDRIVIWNTHNGVHNDRGTLICNLVLLRKNAVVSSDRLSLNWTKDECARNIIFPRRDLRIDGVRIDVVKWTGHGGGLAEVEVYRGDVNLALGCAASATGEFDSPYIAKNINDGQTDSRFDAHGIWLLPNNQPGSILISLNRSSN